MLAVFWKSLAMTPIFLLGITLSISKALSAEVPSAAITSDSMNAAEVPGSMNQTTSVVELTDGQFSEAMTQVTSVSQLTDVKPTDWAFQALQSLVERYGCIVGYPDKTYRGNRALSRYEFAAGLNACLDKIQELIAAGVADLATREDLEKVKKMMEDFAPELAVLRGRTDALEVRTATLEKQQFSTTTKLFGEVIFSVGGAFGDNKAVSANLPITGSGGEEGEEEEEIDNSRGKIDDNIFFSDRVRLELDTSFTGRDRLKLRLQALNTPELKDATGTNAGRLQWDGGFGGNRVNITIAEYLFPIGDNTIVRVVARDEMYRMLEEDVEAVSPLESDGNGALSKFMRFNPLFRLGGEYPAGASISHDFSNSVRLSLAYLGSPSSNDSTAGLFNSSYVGLANLTVRPARSLTLGLTYAHSYSQDLRNEDRSSFDFETGSKLATNPFPSEGRTAALADSFGAQAAWRITSGITLAGWAGYTRANRLGGSGRADILNWAAQLVFPDLGKEGNLGAIAIGMPPKVISNSYNSEEGGGKEPNSTLHIEALYRYQVTDNIAITPGVIYIINPENNRANDNFWVGVIRTTFTF